MSDAMNILFVCTGNSCHSKIVEGWTACRLGSVKVDVPVVLSVVWIINSTRPWYESRV